MLVAVLFVAFVFLYRFNTLNGRFGGFDNDEFATLTRVDMLLAGEQPLRDFADGELRAVWPSLTYEIPALAQRLWGRDLFVHACLTAGALALCTGIVFLLARRLSRSWIVGLLAAALVFASMPNPYNYPKVLVLTIAVGLMAYVMSKPTPARIGLLSAWTVIAALFRHDYGVYVLIGAVVGIIARDPRPLTVPARRVAIYAGVAFVLALPSMMWVAKYAGIPQYVHSAFVSSRTEELTRRLDTWPTIDITAPLETDSLVVFNYYGFWAIPLVGLAVLRPSFRRMPPPSPVPALGLALVAMTFVVNHFFLRSNLLARFGDASAAVALVGAWIVGVGPTLKPGLVRSLVSFGTPVLLTVMVIAFIRANDVVHQLEISGLSLSPSLTKLQFAHVSQGLRALPPLHWKVKEKDGTLAMARYLAECTAPDDRVLIGTYADEIPYFARRYFAGGQGYFAFGFLRSDADQRLAVARILRQSVPVVVTDLDYEHEFATNYPLVERHVAAHYREVGVISSYGQPLLRVFVESSRQPRGTDPVLGFPCFQ